MVLVTACTDCLANNNCNEIFADEEEESIPNEAIEYFCDEQGVETYYDSLDECEQNCVDGCWMTESSDSSDESPAHGEP